MTEAGLMADAPLESIARQLGEWDCGRPGPTLLVIAGMHGNEPGGVHAVRRVLGRLQELEAATAGRLVALAGNTAALAVGRRFLDRDLNRGWSAAAIAGLRERAAAGAGGAGLDALDAEDEQQLLLLEEFERVLATASGPVVVLDLHSSSAFGSPFLLFADTIDNRRLGLSTGVPMILGIEETIDGASLEWFAERGVMALAIEGGQHDDPATIDCHEAVLWRALDYLGMLAPAQAAGHDFGLSEQAERLRRAVGDAPSIVEIIERRAITPADEFEMAPGFSNFHAVAKGTLLAKDRSGELRAPRAAIVLLPLYQSQGEDGYFLARPVRAFWLHLAAGLRAMRCDRLVSVLPGVRRDPDDSRTILVNRQVARWFVTEVFHLLGFRKRRPRGDRLAFTRRFSLPENRRLAR
ncbi:MAG: succinylglutamate desuccinylase/aspartoacylase family protein [bacterium]|nr:succinylglutamate desuccinylase/aspartoacylase family protein [bacterium]